MKEKNNLCMECPVRGQCCYLSAEIAGHNLTLFNQPCEHLDKETGLCTTYETRFEIDMCGELGVEGGLPKECLYLIDNPELETFPKEDIRKIAHTLSGKNIMEYNALNNIKDLRNYIKESEI